MKTWRDPKIVVMLALMAWGCGMAEVAVFQPKPLDGMKEVPASEHTRKLDAEVTAFLRNRYTIASARFYEVPASLPWIAISKSVQNQMAEKSIHRTLFEWYEPGIDFVEVYPQGKSAAMALAMPKESDFHADKLVGFYVLSAPGAAKK